MRDLRLYTSDENEQKIRALLQRRIAGEPLAYLIGERLKQNVSDAKLYVFYKNASCFWIHFAVKYEKTDNRGNFKSF